MRRSKAAAAPVSSLSRASIDTSNSSPLDSNTAIRGTLNTNLPQDNARELAFIAHTGPNADGSQMVFGGLLPV